MTHIPTLVLASTSPWRRQLLERLGLPFTVTAPHVDESPLAGEQPEPLARRLAVAKARAAAACGEHDNAWFIGSDQVAVVDGERLEKPGQRDRALRQLRRLQGRTARFHTGLCLYHHPSDEQQDAVETVTVRFRSLSGAQMEAYVDRDTPWDCAGAFKAEGAGIMLIDAMEGRDPNTLTGLPLMRLCDMLLAAGWTLPPPVTQ